jgi:predicted RNase H-like nuclease
VHDELDALTSALVGFLYLAGSYEAIGNIDEGYLIIPAFKKKRFEESGGE